MKTNIARVLDPGTKNIVEKFFFKDIKELKSKLRKLNYNLIESATQLDVDLFLVRHPNYEGGGLISSSSKKYLNQKTKKIVKEMIQIIKINNGV